MSGLFLFEKVLNTR